MKKLLALLITLTLIFSVTGCGQGKKSTAETGALTPAETQAAETSASKWSITIEGVSDKAMEYSSDEFNKLGTVEIDAVMKKKDGTEQKGKWTGVPLLKLLESLKVKEYSYVVVEAKDGYSKEYTPDLVESQGTILGIKVDGKELDSGSGPVELVVNGKGSNWWIKNVSKIKVVK